MNTKIKPMLSFWQIWNMSFGFLGIQYGFGLQQANLSPIFRYLGAEESKLAVLWLAGPVTGLLIQPIIGAISDGTWTRFGRRKPFFLIGALTGSVAVMLMPYSPFLWMAVGLFWILDASMNTAMEPYRAMVGDKLNDKQRTLGFSVQTFMIAGGQIAAGFMPLLLLSLGVSDDTQNGTHIPDIVKYSFIIGVVAMMVTMIWTNFTTDEYPPDNLEEFRAEQAAKGGIGGRIVHAFTDIWEAVADMPKALRRIWWVKLFTWYGLPFMWQHLSNSIARHSFNAPTTDSPNYAVGSAHGGIAFIFMNVTTVVMAFLIPTVVKLIGTRLTYAVFLLIGGLGFISMLFVNNFYGTVDVTVFNGLRSALTAVHFPYVYEAFAPSDTTFGVADCMVLVGIAWSAIITIPFIMTTKVVSPKRIGVYMGLLNAFICIPQIMNNLTAGTYFDSLLKGDPRNALVLCGICFILAAAACLFITSDVEPKYIAEADVLEAETRGVTMSEA
ncbi:MAG: MFS transporter [Acidobacteria bacterium]|nr:MFS transporter [Acidobacteriota bacterium]